jgi:hypothetical protein
MIGGRERENRAMEGEEGNRARRGTGLWKGRRGRENRLPSQILCAFVPYAAPSVSISVEGGEGPYVFGTPLTLACSYDSTVTGIQWFINARPVAATTDMDQRSTLVMNAFQEEGFYQCFVSGSAGSSAGARLLVRGPSTS